MYQSEGAETVESMWDKGKRGESINNLMVGAKD